jgi:hypothetical protein
MQAEGQYHIHFWICILISSLVNCFLFLTVLSTRSSKNAYFNLHGHCPPIHLLTCNYSNMAEKILIKMMLLSVTKICWHIPLLVKIRQWQAFYVKIFMCFCVSKWLSGGGGDFHASLVNCSLCIKYSLSP